VVSSLARLTGLDFDHSMVNIEPIVRLVGLCKNYRTPAGEFLALKNIDLEVYPGEFVAVVGKSGAGKTTLVNMISSIDHSSSGSIMINGKSVSEISDNQKDRWRGLTIGMVFQFFQLLPNINLVENITIPMDFCNTIPFRERKERALDLLEQVGLLEHAYKVPSKISGGQQQRVAIARALANDPPLIVADEPTGNLDSHTAGEIFDLFNKLVDQRKTLLVVTHDKEIASFASRTIEIIDGQIADNKYLKHRYSREQMN
jgi:putative ABC transport system ATP-binding protein